MRTVSSRTSVGCFGEAMNCGEFPVGSTFGFGMAPVLMKSTAFGSSEAAGMMYVFGLTGLGAGPPTIGNGVPVAGLSTAGHLGAQFHCV